MTRQTKPKTQREGLDAVMTAQEQKRMRDELRGFDKALSPRKMPRQKPGQSIQTYGTPPDFIAAVKARFGIREFTYDLAASVENTKAKHFFCEEEDSLKQDWTKLRGDLWLNPPFARIEPWAKKCAASASFSAQPVSLDGRRSVITSRRIFFLTPASIGANWFAEHVDGKALVLLLNGRLCFDGKGPYPKDCTLAVFGVKPGYAVWRWKESGRGQRKG